MILSKFKKRRSLVVQRTALIMLVTILLTFCPNCLAGEKFVDEKTNSDPSKKQEQEFIEELKLTVEEVKDTEFQDNAIVQKLPTEIVVGQAIVESGYGKSHASKKKNNILGLTRQNGRLMVFQSTKDCIIKYFEVINEHPAYRKFRSKLEEKGEIKIPILVNMLAKVYAEDENYAKKVLWVIKKNL
jgi:uncharacterized FlgJ-related protein